MIIKYAQKRKINTALVIKKGFDVAALFLSGSQAISSSQTIIELNVMNWIHPERAPAAGERHLYASVALR